MNDYLAFRAIDRRLGYKLVLIGGKSHIEDVAMLRVQKGSFEASGKLFPIPMAMTDGEALATVQGWSMLPHHEVVITACCCMKCHTEEAKAFQRTVGRISHGIWPECMAAEIERMTSETDFLLRTQVKQNL